MKIMKRQINITAITLGLLLVLGGGGSASGAAGFTAWLN
jgi:hypothetical protein